MRRAGRSTTRERRGFVLVPVLVLAVVFLLVIETSLTLLVTSMRDSRRREAVLDARQLALSGLEWGESCVAAMKSSCGEVLGLAGGEVEVRAVKGVAIVTLYAEGRVSRGGRVFATHTLVRRVSRPFDEEPEPRPEAEPQPDDEPPPPENPPTGLE